VTANFVISGINNTGGSGSGFTGPNPNLILPPVNVSQTGGGYVAPPAVAPYIPPAVAPYIPPAPAYVAPPPAASSSSSFSSAPINPYDRYRNITFSNNYDTNNYGPQYNPSARKGVKYDSTIYGADQYGQEYNIDEQNLAGFKDRLKKSKKSRYDAPGMTYAQLAAQRAEHPNPSDAMWATYDNTDFGDQYEIGRKYRNRSADEIRRERDNALEMYGMLQSDDRLDKKDKKVQNLMRAVENRVRNVPRHEQNYDYNAFRNLYKVIVEGGHKLKINPKHLSYNSLHHDLKDKVGNPNSKWFVHRYFAADLDDDPHTEDNTGILDRYKRLVELDAVSVLNDMQSFEKTARALFPDPAVYAAFKGTEEAKIMKGFMRLPYAERDKYDHNPAKWIVEYRKEHPNAFLPTLQQTLRKWMTNFLKSHKLQAQSGLSKKEWNDVLNHAASAVSQCVKENKLTIEQAKREVSLAAIQDTLGVYHGIVLDGLQYTSVPVVVQMIRLLRQKAIDKKALAKDRELGPEQLAIYNEIAARGDDDTKAYNENIYKPCLSKFVGRGQNMNKDYYRMPEMIDRNYVSKERVKQMIYDKYKKGNFNIKSPAEMEKLVEVAESVFNNMEDPGGSLNTVSADTTSNFSNKLYQIANDVSAAEYAKIKSRNRATENAIAAEGESDEDEDESGEETTLNPEPVQSNNLLNYFAPKQ
jgi:hypothetical protein